MVERSLVIVVDVGPTLYIQDDDRSLAYDRQCTLRSSGRYSDIVLLLQDSQSIKSGPCVAVDSKFTCVRGIS